MSSVGCKVQGDGSWRDWFSLEGGTSGYLVVDDSDGTSHDSAGSFLTLGKEKSVSFPTFIGWKGAPVSNVRINVVAMRGAPSHPQMQIGFWRLDRAAYHGDLFNPGATWELTTRDFATDPLTGLAWDSDALPLTEIILTNEPGVPGNNDVTLVSARLDYQRIVTWTQPEPRVTFP